MQAKVVDVVAHVASRTTPLRYYHETDDAFTTVTSDSFLGQIYALLHLVNIVATPSSQGLAPRLSAMAVADANPDVIFLADSKCCHQTADSVRSRPGWNGIKAIKANAVFTVDDDVANRWGPRIIDLLLAVSRRIAAL
jgi:iron complex transport system substrate-binding protein